MRVMANARHGVSNQRQLDDFFNRLFMLTTKDSIVGLFEVEPEDDQ